MKELLAAYVKRVRDMHERVRGNEQATKQSIIGPLFTALGYDLTDPQECVPEFKADFGPGRSTKPIDWAFFANERPVFFVEAKESGKKLAGYDEQLADYFAKAPEVKLGILTNGVHWRFYTDSVNPNVMDKEPFAVWNVLADEAPPHEILTVLEKSKFNPELIRTYATRRRQQNLLLGELNRLLEPSQEFVRLAIANLETRILIASVIDAWKPIVANAVSEWARQRTLTGVLESRSGEPAPADVADEDGGKIVTTQDELDAFELVRKALTPARPVEWEDTVNYFKVHLPGQSSWAVCRFVFRKRANFLTMPLAPERAQPLAGNFVCEPSGKGWTRIKLEAIPDLSALALLLQSAYDEVRGARKIASPKSGNGLDTFCGRK